MATNTTLKSIGAILGGFALNTVLSAGTDFALNAAGTFNMENFKANSNSIILVVIIYRFIFSTVGGYLTAKLAPSSPMKHSIILGIIGTVLSILATIAMWDPTVAWYNISVILMLIPSAYIGAKLYLKNNSNEQRK
jgi:hypothetical protein